MTLETGKPPSCFGILDMVFPMGTGGLRESPGKCLACAHKTGCLRVAARGGGGLELEEERVDRAWESGNMGFFRRWSRKKKLARAQEQEKQTNTRTHRKRSP